MIGSLVILWVTTGLLAYGMLRSYYQIIPPKYHRVRLIAGLLGGPISFSICLVLLYRHCNSLSKED